METKTVKNLSAALVCIFIFAVMILVGGLTYYYRRGVENADHVFSSIIERMSSTDQGIEAQNSDTPPERMPQEISLALNEAVDLNANLAALAVTINGNLVYARPLPSPYFVDGPDGLPTITGSSVILKTKELQFNVRGAPVVVTALIYILQPADIFKSARIAFLMVLAATLAAIILIVYLKLYPAENPAMAHRPEKEDVPPPPTPPPPPPEEEPSEHGAPITPLPPLIDDVELEDPEPETPGDPSSIADELTPETGAPVSAEEEAAPPLHIPEAELDPVIPDEDTPEPEPDNGMYSPETGLIRGRYLSQGLASALSDAETAETDLALFVIAIPGLTRTSSAGKLVCTVLANQYKTPAHIYEYKESDFAAIVPGADFDRAVQAAEKVYVRLNEILTPFNAAPEIGIGISNRLTRVISASRLISETEHAVEKALSDQENPIVALKINMDKYRKLAE
jgi:GGDEF domain-containing protein